MVVEMHLQRMEMMTMMVYLTAWILVILVTQDGPQRPLQTTIQMVVTTI